MPTTFSDQFWLINAFDPPPVGTPLSVVRLDITDENDKGVVSRQGNDSVGGSDITRVYPGDTITVTLAGGGTQTFTGTTFYLADGQRVFTPTDGSVLPQGATFLRSTASPFEGQTSTGSFGPPCFTAGTKVATPGGDVAVEQLSSGDEVLVEADGTLQPMPVRWCCQRRFDAVALMQNPKLRPVRILAGALGNGLPTADLLVSRQHRVVVNSRIAQRMFGTREVLVAAIRLTALPGIFVDEEVDEVTYVHLLFDRHEILLSEGVLTESLHTGPEALQSIGPEARQEIIEIFPEVMDRAYQPRPARLIPDGPLQKKLVRRHVKNGIAVLNHA